MPRKPNPRETLLKSAEAIAGSIDFVCVPHKLTGHGPMGTPQTDDTGWKHFLFTVVITLGKGHPFSTPFRMGVAHTAPPDELDVLHSLLLDASCSDQSFEDWCGEFGYDTDSRKAETTWKECRKIGDWLGQSLTSQQIEQLRELFQDF